MLYYRFFYRIFVLLIKKIIMKVKNIMKKNISVLNCCLMKIFFYKIKICRRCIKKCICFIVIC